MSSQFLILEISRTVLKTLFWSLDLGEACGSCKAIIPPVTLDKPSSFVDHCVARRKYNGCDSIFKEMKLHYNPGKLWAIWPLVEEKNKIVCPRLEWQKFRLGQAASGRSQLWVIVQWMHTSFGQHTRLPGICRLHSCCVLVPHSHQKMKLFPCLIVWCF